MRRPVTRPLVLLLNAPHVFPPLFLLSHAPDVSPPLFILSHAPDVSPLSPSSGMRLTFPILSSSPVERLTFPLLSFSSHMRRPVTRPLVLLFTAPHVFPPLFLLSHAPDVSPPLFFLSHAPLVSPLFFLSHVPHFSNPLFFLSHAPHVSPPLFFLSREPRARRSEKRVHEMMDAAKKRAERRAYQRARRAGDPTQLLRVAGSKLRLLHHSAVYQSAHLSGLSVTPSTSTAFASSPLPLPPSSPSPPPPPPPPHSSRSLSVIVKGAAHVGGASVPPQPHFSLAFSPPRTDEESLESFRVNWKAVQEQAGQCDVACHVLRSLAGIRPAEAGCWVGGGGATPGVAACDRSQGPRGILLFPSWPSSSSHSYPATSISPSSFLSRFMLLPSLPLPAYSRHP
ncbi:unnamed protein product [Closterium sp. NIES-65]|nr:unnamed protein product [Closterium sp. NIES-65]